MSYRDELRLTEYLLERLEIHLSGREEPVCLDKAPGDRYHLNVLMPHQERLSEADVLDEPASVTAPPDPSSSSSQNVFSLLVEQPDGNSDLEEAVDLEPEPTSAQHDTLLRNHNMAALGLDFKVSVSQSETVALEVNIRFALYTRHFPTYQEQLAFTGTQLPKETPPNLSGKASSDERTVPLREKYIRHPVTIRGVHLSLPLNRPTQRRIMPPIQSQIDQVLSEAQQDPWLWRMRGRHIVPLKAMKSETHYRTYLAQQVGAPELPPFAAALEVRTMPDGSDGLRISLFLINTTPATETGLDNALRCFVDAHLEVRLHSGRLVPIELVATPEDYQYDRRVWAVGHAASVETEPEQGLLRTSALARYRQPRLVTKQTPPASFADLTTQTIPVLGQIAEAMQAVANQWHGRLESGQLQEEFSLTLDQVEFCQQDLAHFLAEVKRFQAGLRALQGDERLLQAFQATNRVFTRLGQEKGFDRWHLFQICFIVTQLPALAVREGTIKSDTLNWTDVLWFPTGGGKTEAYLGLMVCAAFYDRLRGKSRGVTAWLRFPLRMLSVQQLHRAMRVLWEAEQERRRLPNTQPEAADPFSLGYFVGKNSTPNTLDHRPDNPWRLENLVHDAKLREKTQVIADCPNCHSQQTIRVMVDVTRHRLRHVCQQCQTELPLYVSDDEIYRFLPTLIISTVDKLATLAYQARFSALWGGVTWRCPEPEHGYSLGDYCPVYGCTAPKKARIPITLHDPAPALYIQDELHLLREELGAFTGHYETLLRYCQEQVAGLPPKCLAATATIEGVDHQCRHLYGLPARRFPERGYQRWESFYTTLAYDQAEQPQIQRHYVAFRSHYLNPTEATLLCLEIFHREIRRLYADPLAASKRVGLQDAATVATVQQLLHYYDTTLTYVSSKAAGTRVEKVLDEEISRRLPKVGSRDLVTTFLSSQSSLPEIHEAVLRLEQPPAWDEAERLDALVATSLISHGVDVERFNLMVMTGMPGRIEEYIQASSRSGRRHIGLVVVAFSPWSMRDYSIYHRFVEHHHNLERLVTSVPINRFAKFIVQRTLPGIIAGLVMGYYIPHFNNPDLKLTRQFLKVLDRLPPFEKDKGLSPKQLLQIIFQAYGLDRQRYEAGLEQMMRLEIEQEFRRQLRSLRTSDQAYLFNAFTQKPMRSLRDVGRPVAFEPDPQRTGWEQLRWLNRRASRGPLAETNTL